MAVFDMIERNLADVKRWGIVRTIRPQSVVEHSFYVALWTRPLLMSIGVLDMEVIAAAVEYALRHDMKELVSGDVPTPLKRRLPKDIIDDAASFRLPSVAPPSELVALAVKTLDLFEAAVFLREDQALGNSRVERLCDVIEAKMRASAFALQAEAKSVTGFDPVDEKYLPRMLTQKLLEVSRSEVDPFE